MKTTLSAALIASTAIAFPAFAGSMDPAPAEPVVMQPTPAPVPVLTGRDWTGGSLGLNLGYADLQSGGSGSEDGDGVIGGINAGYDWDFGDWVAGVEGSYNGGEIDFGDEAKLEGLGKVGGRVGYDFGDTLVFGKAGYARALMASDGADPGASDGYYAGVGVETFVAENITVGGDISYNRFENFADASDYEVEGATATASVKFRF